MQKVARRNQESFENLMRRFNRKVQQSGKLTDFRKKRYFEKPLSKKEAREVAIRKKVRKDQKTKSMLLKGF